ncbi:MAG: hypothetical protein CWE10_08535 [Symbiobacterium thermophilum]|uniref:Uncharacterized protein n=1 Tax=Symbiobacterium thermophilum TaxID=2734 RepID=A0A953I916_SYMTR|nr:hypothetical protein [Symbiobacterium thermophilum]
MDCRERAVTASACHRSAQFRRAAGALCPGGAGPLRYGHFLPQATLAPERADGPPPAAARRPGARRLAPGTWHLAPGIWHLAFGTWHLALGAWRQQWLRTERMGCVPTSQPPSGGRVWL